MLTCPSELPNAREIIRTPIDRLVFFAGKRKLVKPSLPAVSVVTRGAGEGTDPHGYMTAHAAMSSGVSAACDVLQTVITSRIKSVLPLQVAAFSLRECSIAVHAALACVCHFKTLPLPPHPTSAAQDAMLRMRSKM